MSSDRPQAINAATRMNETSRVIPAPIQSAVGKPSKRLGRTDFGCLRLQFGKCEARGDKDATETEQKKASDD